MAETVVSVNLTDEGRSPEKLQVEIEIVYACLMDFRLPRSSSRERSGKIHFL